MRHKSTNSFSKVSGTGGPFNNQNQNMTANLNDSGLQSCTSKGNATHRLRKRDPLVSTISLTNL